MIRFCAQEAMKRDTRIGNAFGHPPATETGGGALSETRADCFYSLFSELFQRGRLTSPVWSYIFVFHCSFPWRLHFPRRRKYVQKSPIRSCGFLNSCSSTASLHLITASGSCHSVFFFFSPEIKSCFLPENLKAQIISSFCHHQS